MLDFLVQYSLSVPLDCDGHGHVNAAAVRHGGERVQHKLVGDAEQPRVAQVLQDRGLQHGHDVDGRRAQDEDQVKDGQTQQEVVEGEAAEFSEEDGLDNLSCYKCTDCCTVG